MALTDKNIVITPNVGQSEDPKIVFSGADASTTAQDISLRVYPQNNGTLSFEGSAGQLFSISNSLSGILFSVNDISGIPSIEVLDTGVVKIAQYSGNVLLGSAVDSGQKLQVTGNIKLTGTITSTLTTGTAPLTVASTTLVTNLNADLLDDLHAASYASASTVVARDGNGDFATRVITLTSGHDLGIRSSDSAYNAIYLDSYSDNTWFRNTVNTWTFQGYSAGSPTADWTQTISIYLQPVGTAGADDKLIEIGQRNSHVAAGDYKGVRIVHYTGSTVVDGYFKAGTTDITGPLTQTYSVSSASLSSFSTTLTNTYNTAATTYGTVIDVSRDPGAALATGTDTTQALRVLYDRAGTAMNNAAATVNDYAGYFAATTTTNPTNGTDNLYGLYASAVSKDAGAGTSTAFGIYATASGADANYAGFFEGAVVSTAYKLKYSSNLFDLIIPYGSDANGLGAYIQTGAALIVGSGESGGTIYTNLPFSTEELWLSSDYSIKLITNVQNGYGNRKEVTISTDGYVGILKSPTVALDVGGDAYISGNLTVNGVTTTINTSTLTVDDKNIELGSVGSGVVSTTGTVGSISGSGPWTATITGMSSTTGLIVGSAITATNGTGSLYGGSPTSCVVASIVSSSSVTYTVTGGTTPTAGTITNITTTGATDITADGGGITLKGATDKTILWGNSNWTSNQSWNLSTGLDYKINNVSVLNATTLGSSVTASSLTSVGTLTGLTVSGNIEQTGTGSSGKLFNNYTSGFAGAGWQIDYGSSTTSKSFAEFDNLSVRGTMRVYELLINQIRATNGSVFVSSTGKVATATLASGTLGADQSTYDFTTDDNTNHGFSVNDLIRAQRFTGAVTYQVNMQVTAAADTTHFTAKLIGANAFITGTVDVLKGLEFVRLGSTSNTNRQGSVYLTADDSNAPFIDIVDGITAHTDWNTSNKIKARLGKLTGITSNTLGTLDGYGLYTNNVYLEGNANIVGTLAVGGGSTIGNTFYVGKIQKNLITNSDVAGNDFSIEAIWTKTNNSTDVTAPDGSTKTVKLVSGTSGNTYFRKPAIITYAGNTTYTQSVWIRTANGTTGSLTFSSLLGSKTLTITDTWQRYTLTFTTPASPNSSNIYFGFASPTNSRTYYFWGFQLEIGATATPYQRTDTVLSSSTGYGVWGSAGGFGGTIQDPVVAINSYGLKIINNATFQSTLTANTIVIGNVIEDSTTANNAGSIRLANTGTNTTSGFFGYDASGNNILALKLDGTAYISGWSIGASSITATNISLTSGAANTANISVGTGSNLAGLNSPAAGTDIAFWAGNTYANRASAAFMVTADGAMTTTSGYIGNATNGWIIGASGLTAQGTSVLTIGNTKIGYAVQDTNNGIFVSTGNYWYTDNKFSIGGSNGIVYDGSSTITLGSNTVINGTLGVGSLTNYPPDSFLTLYWNLNNNFDAQNGTAITGTGANVTFAAGVSGLAGVFTGSTTAGYYVTAGTIYAIQARSFSFWAKSTATSSNRVFDHGGDSTGAFYLNYSTTNKPLLYLGNNYRYWLDVSALDDGNWHHYVINISGGAAADITTAELWIDGVSQTATTTLATDPPTAWSYLRLGYQFTGSLCNFRVYNRKLVSKEILSLYSNPPGSDTKISGNQITTGYIKSSNFTTNAGTGIDLDNEVIRFGGSQVGYNSNNGIFIGKDTTYKLSLKSGTDSLLFDANAGTLIISGAITATSGKLGGSTNYWNITSGLLTSVGTGSLVMSTTNSTIKIGSATDIDTGDGIFMKGDGYLRFGTATNAATPSYIKYDSNGLTIKSPTFSLVNGVMAVGGRRHMII